MKLLVDGHVLEDSFGLAIDVEVGQGVHCSVTTAILAHWLEHLDLLDAREKLILKR